jgi:hypothetical protein
MATAIAYHVSSGAHRFDSASDASFVCNLHSEEWSLSPWPRATVAPVDDKATLAENEPTQVCDRCGQPLKGFKP